LLRGHGKKGGREIVGKKESSVLPGKGKERADHIDPPHGKKKRERKSGREKEEETQLLAAGVEKRKKKK